MFRCLGPFIEPSIVSRTFTDGEALGFDYVTLADHIMMPRNLQSKPPYSAAKEFPAGSQTSRLEQPTITAYTAAFTEAALPACGEGRSDRNQYS
jgi:hypothetical protein